MYIYIIQSHHRFMGHHCETSSFQIEMYDPQFSCAEVFGTFCKTKMQLLFAPVKSGTEFGRLIIDF